MPTIAFYESGNFLGERGIPVYREKMPADSLWTISNPRHLDTFLSYFNQITFDRMGVMEGEYIAHEGGMLLIDRNANCIIINTVCEDTSYRYIFEKTMSAEWLNYVEELVSKWGMLSYGNDMSVISHQYLKNYFHFTFDFIPKVASLRDGSPMAITQEAFENIFQKDLMHRVLGERGISILDRPVRVINPRVSYSQISYDSVKFVRESMGISTNSGERNIYIRRGGGSGRETAIGSNIHESDEFLKFLRDYNFDIVEFGAGDIGVQQQVNKISGARVVLSLHGANLTNVAYVNGRLDVIEIFSNHRIYAGFAQIFRYIGFGYYPVVSDRHLVNGDVIVDVDLLYRIMAQLI